MRFNLIDRIADLRPDVSARAVKTLSLAEEYLAGHFPGFPVMPGALILEAMTQTGAWLIRFSEDFAHSMIVLRQANNIRYARFVQPGQMMSIDMEVFRQDESSTTFRARAAVAGQTVASARLFLHRYNLADRNPLLADRDRELIHQMRKRFAVLYKPDYEPAPSTP